MIEKGSFKRKNVDDIVCVISGDIISITRKKKADAIVNAAKPTLMGGGGVDGAIHAEMDKLLSGKHGEMNFNDLIKKQVENSSKKGCSGKNDGEGKVLCEPGNAVLTDGHQKLARYIIHGVGPKYDGGSQCLQTLQHCYEEIMKIIFEHPQIQTVTIPIIGSGNYGFSMKVAFRIALVTICNQLIECKHNNYDAFSNIKKIYLVVYNERTSEYDAVNKIYEKNRKLIMQEKRMIPVDVFKEQCAYVKEIFFYDSERRYCFTMTKYFRLLLVLLRFVFLPSLLIRHWTESKGWRFRRIVIEVEAILTALLPLSAITVLLIVSDKMPGYLTRTSPWIIFVCGICIYFMVDTITYLLSLIFLADIQRPSANQIRSFLVVVFNYLQMIFSIAVFYCCYLWKKISFWKALDYTIYSNIYELSEYDAVLRSIQYIKTGLDFIFLALIFTYIISQLRPRQFMKN